MRKGQIFRSEGGYRVAFGVYNDSPVMDSSPWFETLAGARIAREKKRLDDEYAEKARDAIESGLFGPHDDGGLWQKYDDLKRHAKAVARDDDPMED